MGLTVNGQTIDATLIEQEVKAMREDYEKAFADMDPDQRQSQLLEWATENVIERTLLQQEACTLNMQVDTKQVDEAMAHLKENAENLQALYEQMQCKSENDLREQLELSMKTEQLVATIQKKATAPSDEAIKAFYDEHQQEFWSAESVSCAHIVKNVDWQTNEDMARQALEQAKQELDQGKLFQDVCAKYSDCPDDGGSLGQVRRGQMVEEFEDIIFNLGPGQKSDIFRTRFGFHIATVFSRQAPELVPLEDVKEEIIAQLKEQSEADMLYEFIDGLKENAQIEKN